jgi:UDP-N-acetylmuramoyl-L-alanyl-D-glutamate--2,6-diaminopimelate ligase
MLDAGDRTCAMEASSHASAQHRLDCVRFRALVFTNLTQDHLDFHGSMEAYFEAKRRLFVSADETLPPAAVNVDGPYGRRLADELRARGSRLVSFGFAADADVRPDELELTPTGARFRCGATPIETRLRGRFNVENVLGAVAAGRLLGIADEAVARGIRHLTGVPGRFEAVEEGQTFSVIVDYAHTPDALENVLASARGVCTGRVICVFGCGGERDRTKRPEMGRVAARLADWVVVTSDNPRGEEPLAIIEAILAGTSGEGATVDVEPDRQAAIGRAIGGAGEGDVVVIAGKGHEPGQTFADSTLPFSDREEAREALRRLGTGAAA